MCCCFPQEEQVSDEVDIDHRVHSRLIGARGKAIAKVMERFHVDIRFPRDKQSNTVTITGMEENVEDAKEHLVTMAEDYVSWPPDVACVCVCVCVGGGGGGGGADNVECSMVFESGRY